MKKKILEVCVDSVKSARIAYEAGADRLELCGNLVIGGTTPSPYLFKEIKKNADIPIRVMIRPRYGDFLYDEDEIRIMLEEIKMFNALGADGVVTGAVKSDGTLNMEVMRLFRDASEGMKFTLHRAFDVCSNPMAVIEEAAASGIDTILTSGQKRSCLEGKEKLREFYQKAEGKIEILAGGGVEGHVIQEIYDFAGITEFHMSGKKIVDSQMIYRNRDVNMGIDSLSEYAIYSVDATKIRAAKKILNGIYSGKV